MPDPTTDSEPTRYREYACAERVSCYGMGRYHPVNIDDTFQDRYRVAHKLGHGAYGTVWLVEDLQLERFVALKVLTADASTRPEIEVVSRLMDCQTHSEGSDGSEYVLKIFDVFEIKGPNGTHWCIVTEVLGASLASYNLDEIYPQDMSPFLVGKRVSLQIARGVAYLHRCGVLHGGRSTDLHLKNVLFSHPKLEKLSREDIPRYFGELRRLPVERLDGDPIPPSTRSHFPQLIIGDPVDIPLLELCLESSETVQVKICDFSEALLLETATTPTELSSNCPRVYAAPELLFHERTLPNRATDVWALAVLIHMVLTGGATLFYSYYGIEKEVILGMVLTLGKLPERWWSRWAERSEFFDEGGAFLCDPAKFRGSLMFLSLSSGEEVSESDLKFLEYLLRKMVRYEMQDRISADEVVSLMVGAWNQDGR